MVSTRPRIGLDFNYRTASVMSLLVRRSSDLLPPCSGGTAFAINRRSIAMSILGTSMTKESSDPEQREDLSDKLLRETYQELRRVANKYLTSRTHTLQPTALVHEAYLKLSQRGGESWRGRDHFIAVASLAMRHVLVNHARERNALKRAAGKTTNKMDELLDRLESRSASLPELDDALRKLGEMDERQASIISMRFFAGYSFDEIARAHNVSRRTVERDWRMARAWLRTELGSGNREAC